MKYFKAIFIWFVIFAFGIQAQEADQTQQDAIYQRPFISIGKTATAVGGYLEANTNYFSEDGVSEGFTMEMRRFNIFLYSTIIPRVKFLSELEFEHGTEEINLETALIDFEFNPALVFRVGVLLPPIGAFNQNHDSPKWEFVERPLVATQVIPSTLSEIGFGFNGKFYPSGWQLTYDLYLVNGLTDGVILNEDGRTFLQAGKDEERLGEDNNGEPMVTGRFALQNQRFGEIGLSYYGGTYNTYKIEGTDIDEKRRLSLYAVDFNTEVKRLTIQGEIALANIDVPDYLAEIYGEKQWGGYVDFIYPVLKRNLFNFENAVVNASLRLERIDYNVGTFASTGEKIYDEVSAIAVGIGFRPSANTVLRANFRRHWQRDILGNPTIHIGGFQFGIASYF